MTNPQIWLPYCGEGPGPAEWLARWNMDPLLLAALAAAAALFAWRPPAGSSGRAQAGLIGLLLVLFVSPLCALGSALFIARVVHHVVLATALAALAVSAFGLHRRALPGTLAVWTAVQALTFWAWHAPPLYGAALSSDLVFWAMQLTITATAALWWAKLRQAPAAAGVVALLATMVLMGVLGALITFAGTALYAPHWLTTQIWGLTPLEDQQIAGILMWAPASVIYLFAACSILYRALGGEPASMAAGAERSQVDRA
jgi:putative membrane protein